jgi:hypothetical protein
MTYLAASDERSQYQNAETWTATERCRLGLALTLLAGLLFHIVLGFVWR